MTLLQLRNAVIANIGGRDDKDTIINDAINFSLSELQNSHIFKELLEVKLDTLLNTENTLALPADYFNILKVVYVDTDTAKPKLTLVHTTRPHLLDRNFDLDSSNTTGKPIAFFIADGLINVYPYADANYDINIYYVKKFPTLSDDTDSTIHSRFDLYIIAWATSYLFDHLEQFDNGLRWMSRAEMYSRKLISGEVNNLGVDTSISVNQLLTRGRFRHTDWIYDPMYDLPGQV